MLMTHGSHCITCIVQHSWFSLIFHQSGLKSMQEGDLEGYTTQAEARPRKLDQVKCRSSTLSNDCTRDLIDMLEGKAENRHTEMVDLVKQTASEMMQQSSRLLETERQDRNARAQQPPCDPSSRAWTSFWRTTKMFIGNEAGTAILLQMIINFHFESVVCLTTMSSSQHICVPFCDLCCMWIQLVLCNMTVSCLSVPDLNCIWEQIVEICNRLVYTTQVLDCLLNKATNLYLLHNQPRSHSRRRCW